MKKLISLVTVLLAVAVIFCGCGSTGYSNGLSELSGEVGSNGGFAVEKGDYVYFVNGVGSSTDDNTYGKVTTGALVRVKKSDLAAASAATDLGEDKYYQEKTQIVIPSLFVAGDKTSGFWIFGDQVFYATPTTAQNKKGEVENIKRSSIKKMADAFGVSPAYLMGWDEPSKNESSFSEKIQENFGTESIELLTLFQKLNENGKRKAIENLQYLTAIEKYTTSEKVYNVKIAAQNGEFKETTITESELHRIKNLPDAEEF